MSCFSRFCKKGTTVNKKLSIDENFLTVRMMRQLVSW